MRCQAMFSEKKKKVKKIIEMTSAHIHIQQVKGQSGVIF